MNEGPGCNFAFVLIKWGIVHNFSLPRKINDLSIPERIPSGSGKRRFREGYFLKMFLYYCYGCKREGSDGFYTGFRL